MDRLFSEADSVTCADVWLSWQTSLVNQIIMRVLGVTMVGKPSGNIISGLQQANHTLWGG